MWADAHKIQMRIIHCYQEQKFSDVSSFELLLIMGGPMSVRDEKRHPCVGVYYEIGVWKVLPEKVPVHFSFSGVPNRWTGKGAELVVLFCMPWIMAAFMYGIGKLSRKYPSLLSVPRKKEFLALPPERQEPLWSLIDEMMAGMASAMIILFLGVIRSIEKAATGTVAGLSWEFFAVLCFFIVFCIVYVVKINRKVSSIIKSAPC